MTLAYTQEELQAASYAALRAHATSEQAKALVAKLSSMVEEHTIQAGLRQRKRRDTAGKLEYATGAFLADLMRPLDAEEPNAWVYKSLNKKSFTGAPVGRHAFHQLYNGLAGLGLRTWTPGLGRALRHGKVRCSLPCDTRIAEFLHRAGSIPHRCARSLRVRVRPSQASGRTAEAEAQEFVQEHRHSREAHGVRKETSGEGDGHVISELNEFFRKHTLRRGVHHGYIRIFHNGDDPDFDWDKGGRLYSQRFTDSYQAMSSERRRKMTIDGEPVAEIDISGSYLTIFLSLYGLQLDLSEDPYLLPGLGSEHRAAVKQWFVGTFGNSKPIRRWPKDMLDDDPGLREHRVADISKAVFAAPVISTASARRRWLL